MAVPNTLTTLDISGKYTLNKSLVDLNAVDEVLRLQGVSWIVRKAAKMASVSLSIKHYKDTDGVEHIEIEQGGVGKPNIEKRILIWKESEHETLLFGSMIVKSRRAMLNELDVPYLKEGWTTDTDEHGVIHNVARSKEDGKWLANQTWGIENYKGERRHVRHIKVTGLKGEEAEAKLIYDYVGPL